EQRDDADAEDETRKIQTALAAKQTPTKSVDDSHHGVEAVPKAQSRRHDPAGKTDRRYIQPELDDERNNEPKVAVFDIQGRDQERRTETRQYSQDNKRGQQEDMPGRSEAVPKHQHE